MNATHRTDRSNGTSNALIVATTLAARLMLLGATSSLALASGAQAQGLPSGGSVSAGSATISTGGNAVRIDQSSQAAAINWNSFNIAQATA